jgi:hypothetical protein
MDSSVERRLGDIERRMIALEADNHEQPDMKKMVAHAARMVQCVAAGHKSPGAVTKQIGSAKC